MTAKSVQFLCIPIGYNVIRCNLIQQEISRGIICQMESIPTI